MVCPNCNASFQAAGSFCPRCGFQLTLQSAPGATPPADYGPVAQGPPPPAYGQPGYPPPGYVPPGYAAPPFAPSFLRVQRNLQLMSILWFCFAAYRLLSALAVTFFFHAVSRGGFLGRTFPFDSGARPFLAALVPFALVTTAALAGLSALVGFAMMQRRPWGRTYAIVLSILSLLKFPLGTALGIYTLWVLAPAASAIEYDTLADRTRPGF